MGCHDRYSRSSRKPKTALRGLGRTENGVGVQKRSRGGCEQAEETTSNPRKGLRAGSRLMPAGE
jgi:hypothetical protein